MVYTGNWIIEHIVSKCNSSERQYHLNYQNPFSNKKNYSALNISTVQKSVYQNRLIHLPGLCIDALHIAAGT